MDTPTAAGSLFTSCVTNTEPQGIKDIRQAKADYLESLSNLKKSEAKKVEAEANFKQANADYRQAEVAYQKILNEIAQCDADARKEQLKAQLKYWETELKKQEKALAWAEYDLQQTLKDIAVLSEKLSQTEREAVDTYTWEYQQYISAQKDLREAEAWLYYATDNYADYVGWLETENAEAAAYIAKYQEIIDNLPIDAGQEEVAKFFEEYEEELAVLKVDSVNLQKEFNLFKVENVNESIKGFSKDLSKWFVQNVALPAPFHMAYKTALPDNEIVVAAFEKYINNWKLRSETNGFQIADGEIAANFNAAPIARKKIFGLSDKNDDPTDVRSLYNVVDALSRELVIDTAATAVDTAGLAKAVADAKTDYAKTKAALEAGADAYAAAALETLKAKKQVKKEKDSLVTVAVNNYKADKDTLKAAIEDFVNVWNDIAEDDQVMDKNDTTDLWKAFKNLIDVRAAVLPYEGEREYFYYRKGTDNEGKIDTGKIKFTELKKGQILKTNAKIKALDDVTYGGSETSLSDAINQFFGCQYFRNHMSISEPDGKLYTVDYDELYYGNEEQKNTNTFLTLFYDKFCAEKDLSKIYEYKTGQPEYKPEALSTAEAAQTAAKKADSTATKAFVAKHKEFYTDVYGKFWGIEVTKETQIDSSKEVKVSETEKVMVWKFASTYTPLVQNFAEAAFTENPQIVKFDVTTNSYKEKVFYNKNSENIDVYTNAVNVNHNDELSIVLREFELRKTDFEKLLFTKVLYKEAVQKKYTGWDAVDVKEAIEALNDICDEFAAAYDAASEKQMKDSEPFFAFLEGLIGEDVLEEVFGRIDNAIATYNEYKPAVPGFDPVTFIIEQIAAGTLSSREVVIGVFEDLLCGEWSSCAGKEAYESYAQTYVQLQVAAAFAGDQVEALLLDVLEKFVDALDIDIVGWDESLKSHSGNIIEKILFGTVSYGKIKLSDLPEAAMGIVLPTVTSYIVGDLGGIVGELIEKHFAEWAEEWAEFDKKIAENQAEIDALNKLADVYTIYYNDLEAAKAAIAPRLENAKSIYNWTNEALAAIEAGADPYTVWMENVTDWIEYLTKTVDAAAVKLATAEAAYNQVIKNHE